MKYFWKIDKRRATVKCQKVDKYSAPLLIKLRIAILFYDLNIVGFNSKITVKPLKVDVFLFLNRLIFGGRMNHFLMI